MSKQVQRIVLLIATLAAFLTPFMSSSINIALPPIGAEFSMEAVLLGWVATSYLLAAAVFLVPFGKLADIYGRKKIFAYGVAVYTLASLLCGLSTSGVMLIAFRVIQGIGSALMFGTSVAMLTSAFPVGERGRVLGINVAAVYTGLSLGPFLGGFLTQQLGWRSIFFAQVPLGLVVVALIPWKLKAEWAEAQGEKLDWVGSAIYGAALALIMYGFSSLPAVSGAVPLAIGVAALAAFVWWELRVEHPVVNMSLFRHNTVFAFSNLAALVNYAATFAITFLLSLYLQYIKGMTPQVAGTVLVAQPIMQAIFSPFAGRLSDRVESRIVASAGMALTVVGLAALAFLTANTSIAFIVGSLLLLGFGFALFSSPNVNAVMCSVDKRFYGVGSAMLSTMRLTGQMFSMGIAMLLIALFVGNVEITPANYPQFLTSVRTAFIVFSALCLGGVFASLARGNVRQNGRESEPTAVGTDIVDCNK